MGGLGADAALEAADIILMEDEPSKIINAVRIAKGSIRSVRENVLFAIGMKVFLVILAFFGLVTMQSAIIADMVVMVINILNSFEHTKIIATHDMDMVIDLCQRTIILKDGIIAADGPTLEIFSDKELLESCSLELPLRMIM